MKAADNLMDLERQKRQVALMQAAQRCKATSKRTGQPCRAPAVKGWSVCHYHGARGGAPEGKANGNWKHGGSTNEVLALKRRVRALLEAVETLSV